MSKHTPGPWLIYDNGTFVYALGNGGTNVFWADVQSAGSERASLSEKRANARLIAAAPELLDALKAAVDCGMVPNSSASEGGAARYSRQVIVADMIRDAIAKATEGKQ